MQCLAIRLLFLIAFIVTFVVNDATANAQDGYRLAAGDVLGVFVEGVVGEIDSSPPVQTPDPQSDLPPSIGFPAVVRQDGTLSLPLIKPIPIAGLRIEQAERAVKHAYRRGEKPIVCLLYTSPSPRDATLSRMPSSA